MSQIRSVCFDSKDIFLAATSPDRNGSQVSHYQICIADQIGSFRTKAVEWEVIEQIKFNKVKSLILKENKHRLRFLSEDEIKNLSENCPPYLHRIINCALTTDKRRGEILGLKWSQIRNGFINLNKAETNDARQMLINDDLVAMFKKI